MFLLLILLYVLSSCGNSNNYEFTREELSNIYGNVALYMNDVSSLNERNFNRRSYQEQEDTSTLKSVVAFVKWASNLYSNDTFIVTEEIVEFEIETGNNNVGICFLNETNPEQNKLYGTLLVSSDGEIDSPSTLVMHFDVDYDYQTDQVISFEIIQMFWSEDVLNLCFKYDGNKFYILDYYDESEETISVLEKGISVKEKVAQKLETKIFLEEDYSKEYNDAMSFVGF